MRLRSALAVVAVCLTVEVTAADQPRPNVLWISTEDISPDLGCYGDAYAVTPNIDKFATQAVRYNACFTHAGVCAPSRSGLITGMYPPSIGTQHMRCKGVPPADVRCFTEYLRIAGYYCTNNSKTDYQFDPPLTAWNESSGKADWRGRKPGQPFFSVINFTTTHESQIRDPSAQTKKLVAALPESAKHDPAKAVVPPYYPDTPIVRRDLANYADNITAMDGQFAEVLAKLEADGLADDTIVWFWGDHGRGMSRCKRWLYDSGTRTPLLIHVPEKWRTKVRPDDPAAWSPGTVNNDLVAFVDFAPTMLSLCGIPLPKHFQGQAFLGSDRQPPRQYVYGHRDRMDETYDLIRMVRDGRFKYLRNFMLDVSYSQDIAYMNEMPTMKEMRRLHAAGELTGPPALWFRPTKPVEELFDTEADPHEINNLAGDPKYKDVLERMRTECRRWMSSIGDTGLIPEPEFDELKRPGGEWQRAEPPQIAETSPKDATIPQPISIRLSSPLPGSRFVYSLAKGSTDGSQPDWVLYNEAFLVPVETQIRAKAVRIGYRDSDPVRWKAGDAPPTADAEALPPHWREVVDQSGVLNRLLDLKAHDGRTDQETRRAYRQALQDPSPAMRYWALRGLSNLAEAANRDNPNVQMVLERLSKDSSPLVQILAMRLLAERNHQGDHIVALAKLMRTHPQDSVRLHAVTALRDLGRKAAPVRNELDAAVKDGEYVGRVAQSA
ncbi:MAG TPA: sulfatase-like hydrolase/transferase, partial [Planctomycetaceae bacterium]|nr:sulfatase-like hydrolase/transferase [Planctomycetaceae bacterium]